ncbi:preprotein translocase subunit SecA [Candidatus Phytoplasma solani]|uniref:Protein translocase subunit SecA n=4 Tax=Candidatus Phytoplasma TaxID=33926 RepID=A0A421NX68_9MOLU|nr:preprotein translocase subunit SecA [Candidatus Phytoplasma solani]RMI88633.1 preprotein translocase subunit SecA [Candidatus Phytoplasma solani]CCP88387.1 Protein translocase subunit SecA [Candidatus Phytoplasma solani]CCP88880.1 Protein translocase subunit SecA [Candidatus Phytoplasma solani]
MFNFLKKIFNSSKSSLRKARVIANKVQNLSEKMSLLQDSDFVIKTNEFKERYQKGESLNQLLPEAYALAREAAKRVTGLTPYYVQILGAIILHQGNIAEMKTGEGKTLTAVMPAYLNALSGEPVHIVTVNEYLAKREFEGNIGEVFRFLGLSVGLNIKDSDNKEKQKAYLCDILYATNSELGFDYLRDNMEIEADNLVMKRPYSYAIVDEVDSILIDEARTPLIISQSVKETKNLYKEAQRFVKTLKSQHYLVELESKTIELTEEGINKAELFFQIENLYNVEHASLLHHIKNALKAFFTMHKNKDYLVDNNQVLIIDQFTGRVLRGRQFSDGLHQALEAKEGVLIKEETSIGATITYQNFFRLYRKLSGMTGTAKTEEDEFRDIYNMEVIEIPTNVPMIRIDEPDFIFISMKEKYDALIEEVLERHKTGQPILIGATTVEVSEIISKKLKKHLIKHEILNAKNHFKEADIIAKAGLKNSVTIATNMAGRGTDIRLGEGVVELGGLAVLGTERHESRRIDNQLRGRAGRQGDPGYSRFFISSEDELAQRFGGNRIEKIISLLQQINTNDKKTSSKMVTKFFTKIQKKVESSNFDYRKYLLKYDDILRIQREIIYGQRKDILNSLEPEKIAFNLVEKTINQAMLPYFSNQKNPNQAEDLILFLEKNFFAKNTFDLKEIQAIFNNSKNKSLVEFKKHLLDKITVIFENQKAVFAKEEEQNQYFAQALRWIMLKIIDTHYKRHINDMSILRQGIGFVSYGQQDSFIEYQKEGQIFFNKMIHQIATDITTTVLKFSFEQSFQKMPKEQKIILNDSSSDKNITKKRRKVRVTKKPWN